MFRRAALALLLLACGRPEEPLPERPYARKENAAERKMYRPFTPYYYENPPGLARFIAALQQHTGLAPHLQSYPVDRASLQRAAEAFEAAAKEVFGFELSLASPDAAQYDRLFDAHLIDTRANAMEPFRVPREALFYYCAGAHWGEWLVRHRGAKWQLYEPLRPLQSFSDMVGTGDTMCILPFAQVTGKMSDPEGDALAFAADVGMLANYKPPFPLIASPADAAHAGAGFSPPGSAS